MLPLILLSLLPLLKPVNSAGMTSHNIISRRSMSYERFLTPEASQAFGGLSRDRIDAVQGGSPWPDYLYACGDDHNAGEMDHWEPFQMQAARYIRETYPDWIEEGREGPGAGLVAFFNGVVSHYIADENWHGLCQGCESKGFIKEIGYTDFPCTGDLCENAHKSTDTGGEFVAAVQTDISWYPKRSWYMPTQDLVNIFEAMNKTCVTGGRVDYCPTTKPIYINECSLAFYAGSYAVSTFGSLIYPFLSHRLGEYMTSSAYIDSEIGGVDDNAAWTAFMQNRWAEWVLNGPPETDELRDLLSRREDDPPNPKKRIWMNKIKSLMAEAGDDGNPFYMEDAGNGAVRVAIVDEVGKEHVEFLKKLASSIVHHFVQAEEEMLGGAQAISLEQTLWDHIEETIGKGSEAEDLSISVAKATPTKPALFGSQSHQQFAHSFDAASTSSDSCDLVLVGSTGWSIIETGNPQVGKAELYSLCDGEEELKLVGELASATNGEPVYERFGATTKLIDLNGDGHLDAIVCAPSWGGENVEAVVGNYTGRCDFYNGPLDEEAISPSFSIFGDESWGLFGKVVEIGDVDGDGLVDVVIAAPQTGNGEGDDKSNTGAVYVFDSSKIRGGQGGKAGEVAKTVLRGVGKFVHFGQSLQIVEGEDSLIVGSPYFHVEGKDAVGKVEMVSLEGGEKIWTLVGCDHGGVVGGSLKLAGGQGGKKLAIGEIGHNHTSHELRSGRVNIMDVEGLEGEIRLCDAADVTQIEPHDSEKKVLDKLALFNEARFGENMAWSEEGETLLVAAPGGRKGGKIFEWKVEGGGKLRDLGAVGEDGARLGGGGVMYVGGKRILVGAPRASLESQNRPDEEEFGALIVMQ